MFGSRKILRTQRQSISHPISSPILDIFHSFDIDLIGDIEHCLKPCPTMSYSINIQNYYNIINSTIFSFNVNGQ